MQDDSVSKLLNEINILLGQVINHRSYYDNKKKPMKTNEVNKVNKYSDILKCLHGKFRGL